MLLGLTSALASVRATPAGTASEMPLTYGPAHLLLHFLDQCNRVSAEMPTGSVSRSGDTSCLRKALIIVEVYPSGYGHR